MFIDKCRMLTKKGMKNNIKEEYKKALKEIKFNAKLGRTWFYFATFYSYENENEIYLYIMDRLKNKGFDVELVKWGKDMSHTKLKISW